MITLSRLKIGVWWLCCLFFPIALLAQQNVADTVAGADSISITGRVFGSLGRNLSSASIGNNAFSQLKVFSSTSLLPAINTLAGVRMEERSPGSYRLNIRGSALRSPFGVRNVKFYWNGLPFTDAGGNTYFNQVALNSIQQLEILRGPAGSMYGAGTGGLVLMNSLSGVWNAGASAEISAGSFGMAAALAQIDFGNAQQRNRISYAHNQADGYREQSAMRRDNVAWTSHWRSDKSQLTASVMYGNMYYQTPGGLTQTEYKANPSAARPATPGFPSAVQAKAAIWQQNLIAGLNHVLSLGQRWTNTTAVFGSFALVENAAIRNYESRVEPNLGGRTVFAYQYKKEGLVVKWQSGMEYQAGFFNTQVSKNNNGKRDSLRTNDDLRFNTGFVFTQVDFSLAERWFITGGISINANQVSITRQYPSPVKEQSRTYRNEWTPRLQVTRRWNGDAETQFTYSRGFSPPTVGELLPSTGQISTNLEAELADNFELAQSLYFLQHRLRINVAAFYLDLRNALVQQRDASGGDYFVNAGRSVQQGIESSAIWMQAFAPGHFLRSFNVSLAHTYSQFEYREYKKLGIDYAGKALPGVPRQTISLLADLRSKVGLYFNFSWYYNSSIPLNDANTFRAESFHVLGVKAGYRSEPLLKKLWWHLYVGADNLLDVQYSLGNDINAAGNRFFNAAPTRNFYGGLAVGWRKR